MRVCGPLPEPEPWFPFVTAIVGLLTATTTGSTANRKRFTLASQTIAANDVLTLGGANIALAGGTISDTVRGGTAQAASLVLSGISAVAVTIAS